jgi:hypothetical protein
MSVAIAGARRSRRTNLLGFKCAPNVRCYPCAFLVSYPLRRIVVPASNGFLVDTVALQNRNGHFPVPLAVDNGIPCTCAYGEAFVAVDSSPAPEFSSPKHRSSHEHIETATRESSHHVRILSAKLAGLPTTGEKSPYRSNDQRSKRVNA